MKELADGVWQLSEVPPNAINVYLIGDVLIDAATKSSKRRILRQLKGHTVTAHALTHAHSDHQGASHAVCEQLGIPFWVGEKDADAAANPRLIKERQPKHPINSVFWRMFSGPGHPVDRQLREGDEVAGFKVLDVPGHSAGHVAFFRESDRVLVAGDVLNSANPFTGIPGIREPPTFFTPDPAQNRRSAKRLAELEPSLALFGHGPPVRNTKKLVDFINNLPD